MPHSNALAANGRSISGTESRQEFKASSVGRVVSVIDQEFFIYAGVGEVIVFYSYD